VKRVVVDASAVVEYLLQSKRGAEVQATVENPAVELHAPALCDIELASALRALLAANRLALARAREVVEDYADLCVERHGHLDLLERILTLRNNMSAYDATYVALAEGLQAELLTCDEPLARAAAAHATSVHVVLV
jgi:predicted nucleic acid-binding protein